MVTTNEELEKWLGFVAKKREVITSDGESSFGGS